MLGTVPGTEQALRMEHRGSCLSSQWSFYLPGALRAVPAPSSKTPSPGAPQRGSLLGPKVAAVPLATTGLRPCPGTPASLQSPKPEEGP